MVNVLDLLDELEAGDVRLSVRDGKLVTHSPGGIPTELEPHVRRHRDLLIAATVGFRLGVPLAPCNICGRVSAVALRTFNRNPRTSWPRCCMTPGCLGRHQPRLADIERIDPSLMPKPEPDDDEPPVDVVLELPLEPAEPR